MHSLFQLQVFIPMIKKLNHTNYATKKMCIKISSGITKVLKQVFLMTLRVPCDIKVMCDVLKRVNTWVNTKFKKNYAILVYRMFTSYGHIKNWGGFIPGGQVSGTLSAFQGYQITHGWIPKKHQIVWFFSSSQGAIIGVASSEIWAVSSSNTILSFTFEPQQ